MNKKCVDFQFYKPLSVYPFLSTLLEYKNEIRHETLQITSKWIEWPEDLVLNGKWSVIPFYGFGRWVHKNCKACPTISYVLHKIPGLRSAILSRLGPHTLLDSHQGWGRLANNVLRCHYVIQCYEKSCYIQVENRRVHVSQNHIYVFDDSKMHSAGNMSDYDRIVLLIDIKRPACVCKGRSDVPFTTELQEFDKYAQM